MWRKLDDFIFRALKKKKKKKTKQKKQQLSYL